MPGTVKIWWHDGSLKDVRRNTAPVVNEPELGFEQIAVSSTAAASGAVPKDSFLAVIETDVNVRYIVREPGDARAADAVTSKPLARTGLAPDFIGVRPNCTISFIEV